MALDTGASIYRAMAEERGMPRLGASATGLGIRKGKDLIPDSADMVHRPDFDPGNANGLSCAPTISDLPHFLLPVDWGGANKHTVVWQIALADLGPELIAEEDSAPGFRRRHLSIGPAASMPFDDYVIAIEATRCKWQKITKP